MGREILYCTKCGKALTADDFTRGRAHTYDNRQFCAKCLPPRHDPAPTPRPAKRAPSSHRMQPAVREKRSSMPLVAGVAAAAVVAIGAILAAVLSRPAPPPPAPPPEDPGKKLVEQARDFERQNPGARDDVVRRWEAAHAAGGPSAAEARRELDRALAARKDANHREIRELEEKIRERLQAEQFGAAIDVLEEARKRHDALDWTQAVGNRIQKIRSTTDELYAALKAKAVAAQARSDAAAIAEARAKLAVWGRKDLLPDLEAELAKIVPREEIPAGATVLLRFPKEGNRGYNLAGIHKDGGLWMEAWGDKAVMGGFEVIREPFAIPEKGEFWLTYTTDSDKPVILRFRVIAGDKTLPFNWNIPKPDVGRPTRVKVPLKEFQDYGHKFVGVGERVNSVYLQQDDVKARFFVIEAVIFRLN